MQQCKKIYKFRFFEYTCISDSNNNTSISKDLFHVISIPTIFIIINSDVISVVANYDKSIGIYRRTERSILSLLCPFIYVFSHQVLGHRPRNQLRSILPRYSENTLQDFLVLYSPYIRYPWLLIDSEKGLAASTLSVRVKIKVVCTARSPKFDFQPIRSVFVPCDGAKCLEKYEEFGILFDFNFGVRFLK